MVEILKQIVVGKRPTLAVWLPKVKMKKGIGQMLFLVFLLVLVRTSTCEDESQMGGTFVVKMVEQKNPTGRDYHGNCCDGDEKNGFCQTPCTNHLTLDFRWSDDGPSSSSFLTIGVKYRANSITFPTDNPGFTNPVYGKIKRWRYNVTISATLRKDNSSGPLIDTFQDFYMRPAAYQARVNHTLTRFNLEGRRPNNASIFVLELSVFCNPNFYDRDCSRYCNSSNCDVVETPCSHDPCKNGGTCVIKSSTTYACSCPEAWTGSQCQTAFVNMSCSDITCQNKGSCVMVSGKGPTCDCPKQWTGMFCQTDYDECQSKQCLNGGTCVNLEGGFRCTCPHDYEGTKCEKASNPCESRPCRNGGHCNIESSKERFSCSCVGRYVGRVCERLVVTGQVYLNGKKSEISRQMGKLYQQLIKMWYKRRPDLANCKCITHEPVSVEDYIDSKGNDVTKVTYRLLINGIPVDSEQVKKPSVSEYQTYLNEVTRPNGQPYAVMNPDQFNLLLYRQLHFDVNFKGSVYEDDYSKLEKAFLNTFLVKYPKRKGCNCVEFDIKQQQVFTDVFGNKVTRLLYTMRIENRLVNPLNNPEYRLDLNVLKNHLGGIGNNMKTWVGLDQFLTPTSTIYNVYFKTPVADNDLNKVKQQLEKTYEKLDPSLKGKVQVQILKQEPYVTSDGKTISSVKYKVLVDGVVTNPKVPPTEVTRVLNETMNITGPTDNSRYELYTGPLTGVAPQQEQYKLYLKKKLNEDGLAKLKDSLLQAWLTQKPKLSKESTDVEITSVKPMVNNRGEMIYKVNYFLKVNGKRVDASITYPLDNKHVNQQIQLNGHNIQLVDSVVKPSDYHDESSLYKLVLDKQLTSEQVEKLKTSLKKAVEAKYPRLGKVKITTLPQQEYTTSDGKTVHKLLYKVTSDVTSVTPNLIPPLSPKTVTEYMKKEMPSFEMNVLSPDTVLYPALSKKHFSLFMKNKVSPSEYTKLESDIKNTITKFMPELKGKNVKITIKGQEEYLDKNGNKRSRLYYTVDADGKQLDAINSPQYFKYFSENLSPSGAYLIAPGNQLDFRAKRDQFATFVGPQVSPKDIPKFEKAVKDAWLKFKPELKNRNISVEVNSVKKYLDSNGKERWKLSYYVMDNGKVVPRISLPKLPQQYIAQQVTFTNQYGLQFRIHDVSNVVDYDEHQVALFKKHILPNDVPVVEQALTEAWSQKHPNLKHLNVKIARQDEVLTENGDTLWKATYFVYSGNYIAKKSSLSKVDDEFIRSKLKVPLNDTTCNMNWDSYFVSNVTTYPYDQHFALNTQARLQVSLWPKIAKALQMAHQATMPGVTLKIVTDELYAEGQKLLYRLIYFVMDKKGQLLNPYMYKPLNLSMLRTELTKEGVNVQPLHGNSTNMRYHQHVAIFTNLKVTKADYVKFAGALRNHWTEDMGNEGDFKFSFMSQEEHVTSKGETLYKFPFVVFENDRPLDGRRQQVPDIPRLQARINALSGLEQTYAITPWEKLCDTTVTNVANSHTVVLESKLEGAQLNQLSKVLKDYWLLVYPDLKNCSCLEIDMKNVQSGKDVKGKPLYRYLYSLKVNNRDIGKAGYHSLNTRDFTMFLKTVYPDWKVNVRSASDFKSNKGFPFTFTISSQTRIREADYGRVEQSLKKLFASVNPALATCNCVSVKVVNQTQLANGSYAITVDGVIRSSQPDLLSNLLNKLGDQKTCLKANGSLCDTIIIDPKHKFMLLTDKKVADDDMEKMRTSLRKAWLSVIPDSYKTDFDVRLKSREPAVDANGNKVWALSYYLVTRGRQLTPNDVPVMTMSTYNTYMNVKNAAGLRYQVISQKGALPYALHNGLFFSRPVLRVDMDHLQSAIQAAWRQWEEDAGKNGSLVHIKVLGQEEYVDKTGKSYWKLMYFTKRDGAYFQSNKQPPVSLISSKLGLPMTYYKKLYKDLLLDHQPSGTAPFSYHFFIPLNEQLSPSQYSRQSDSFRDAAVHLKSDLGKKSDLSAEILPAAKYTGPERDVYHQLFRLYKNGALVYPGDHADLQHSLIHSYFIRNSDPIYNVTTNRRGKQRYAMAFNVYTDKSIPLGDRFKFSKAIQKAMEVKYPEAKGQLEVSLGRDEPFIIPDCKKVWKISAFVTVNGKPLDGRKEVPLRASELQPHTPFNILDVMQSSSWKQYNYHMPLYLKGQLDPKHISKLETALEQTWSSLNIYQNCKCITVKICKELFLSQDGKGYVTKLLGFVSARGKLIDARQLDYLRNIMAVRFWNLVRQLGLEYAQSKFVPKRSTDSYDVIVKGDANTVDLTSLKKVLLTVWKKKLKDENSTVTFSNLQSYFGNNGERLLRISYVVQDGNGTKQIPVNTESPRTTTLIRAAEDNKLQVSFHDGGLGTEKKSLHTLTVDKAVYYNNRKGLEQALMASWAKNTTFKNKKCIKADAEKGDHKCNIEVKILGADTKIASDEKEVTQVYYKVMVDGKTIPKSYQYVPPSESYVDEQIKKNVADVKRWKASSNKMWSVMLVGQYHTRHLDNLTDTLTMAWDRILGGNVSGLAVNITGLSYMYNDQWGNATRVKYTVTVNGKDMKFEHTPTSVLSLNKQLLANGYTIAGSMQKSAYYMYLRAGSVDDDANGTISNAIIAAYLASNPGMKREDITVNSKRLQQHFISQDEKSLTGLLYTVKVKGADANPMFVKTPSYSEVHAKVKAAGANVCQAPKCQAKALGSMMVYGQVKNSDHAALSAAVTAAYLAANKGLKKGDIEVKMLHHNNGFLSSDGKDVAMLSYAVKRKDGGEVGALVTPDSGYLAPAVLAGGPAHANKLYSGPVTAKQTDEGGMSPFWIPILILLALLLLFLLLALIFAYYARRRAKRHGSLRSGWGFLGGKNTSDQYGLNSEEGGLNKVQLYELSNEADTAPLRGSADQADAAYDAITYDGTLKMPKKTNTLKSSSSFADRSMSSRWYPGYSQSMGPKVTKNVVVLDYAGANPPASDKLTDGKILYSGPMSYHGGDNEMMIRHQLAKQLQQGGASNAGYCLPNATAGDFDFVQVKKKKIKPWDQSADFDSQGMESMYGGSDGTIYIRLTRDLEKTAECPGDGFKCPVHYIAGETDSINSFDHPSVHVATLTGSASGTGTRRSSNLTVGAAGGGGGVGLGGNGVGGGASGGGANGQIIVPAQGEYVETIQTITRTVKRPVGGGDGGGNAYSTEEVTTTTTTSGDMSLGRGTGVGAVNEGFIMDEHASFNNAQMAPFGGDAMTQSSTEMHSFGEDSSDMQPRSTVDRRHSASMMYTGDALDGASVSRSNPMDRMTKTETIVEEFFEENDTIETEPIVLEHEIVTTLERVPYQHELQFGGERQSTLTRGEQSYQFTMGGDNSEAEAIMRRMSVQNNGVESVMFQPEGYETQEMSMQLAEPEESSLIGTLTRRQY